MKASQITALNPKHNIYNLLGEIANEPKRLDESDVNVNQGDAVDGFTKLVLASLLTFIHVHGKEHEVRPVDIDKTLEPYKVQYKKWKRNNGVLRLYNAKKSAIGKNFQHDYTMVKKYHYLRRYIDNGIDITGLLDYRNTDEKQIAHLRKMDIGDVIDYFSNKTDKIKKSYQDSSNIVQSFEISDGIKEHVENLTKSSMFGYPFQNGYYNQIFGGMRKSKFMIRSTVTGGGKTRQALKDFCNVAFSEYYDTFKHAWVKTGNPLPALFISTELNKAELQNIVLSYLTGIESKMITFGQFNIADKPKIDRAVEIMNNSHFYFEYLEDFTASDVENVIDKYVRQKGVEYVNFDYIQDSPRLMQELRESYGNGLRSDQALVYLSKELKRMAEKYNIFVMSATQVNGFFSDESKEKSRTEYTLRGGKSIADKVDYGIITSRFTQSDKAKFSKKDGLRNIHPNYGHHIYKNRSGQKDIIVWTRFNYGNLCEKPLVVTDYVGNIQHDIAPLSASKIYKSNNLC